MNPREQVKLSSNENCYGCSPLALDAILKNYRDVHLYPVINPVDLKEKIAVKYGVDIRNMVTGAGSVGIIDTMIQTFVKQGEEVITFEKSFIAYGQLAGFHNHSCHFAQLSDFRCSPFNLFPYINDKTKLIFIANPNNPTGTIITHHELENFLQRIPPHIIVVIDEAYSEYVTDSTFPDSVALLHQFPNLIILHSFSKIYGLAGLRIGFAIMEENLALEIISNQVPFSLNYLSYKAALAVLDDNIFVERSIIGNNEQRTYLVNELLKLGFNTLPSQSNFVYLWFDSNEEKNKIFKALFNNAILICDLNIFGQEKALRITIGQPAINQKIIRTLSFKK